MEFMPPSDPWQEATATNERETFAEEYVGMLVDLVRGDRRTTGSDGTLEGALHTLQGFVRSSPELVERVAGGRREFEQVRAAIAGNGPSRNEESTQTRGERTMTQQFMPVRNVWNEDAEPGEPVEAPAANEETRYMPTLEDRNRKHISDSGERQFMPPLEDRR